MTNISFYTKKEGKLCSSFKTYMVMGHTKVCIMRKLL